MSHIPDHVEHPSAWLDGKARRIKANANKTRRRKLDAAIESDSEEFKDWLFDREPAQFSALRATSQHEYDRPDYDDDRANEAFAKLNEAIKQWRKRVGFVPDALRIALDDWGGLSEKQLAWARSAFAKNIARYEQRDAEEQARKTSAPHWTAGRQTISGTIQFTRGESFGVGPRGYHSAFSIKGILLLDDGRKCWTSIPRALWPGDGTEGMSLKGTRITITATFSPSDDDPTMAFAKRPTLVDESNAPQPTETPAEGAIVDPSASETPQQAKARRARERRERRKRGES